MPEFRRHRQPKLTGMRRVRKHPVPEHAGASKERRPAPAHFAC
jgi:hypothetical protein